MRNTGCEKVEVFLIHFVDCITAEVTDIKIQDPEINSEVHTLVKYL